MTVIANTDEAIKNRLFTKTPNHYTITAKKYNDKKRFLGKKHELLNGNRRRYGKCACGYL